MEPLNDPKHTPETRRKLLRSPSLPILLVVSCSAAWVISQLSYNALPQLLEPIKETFDRSDEVVTRLYGYELFVFALVALTAAGPLARVSRVKVAMTGGLIAVRTEIKTNIERNRIKNIE